MRWIRAEFGAPMGRIQGIIEEELSELCGRQEGIETWDRATSALLDIARAPRRMVRPQLVLTAALAAGGEPHDAGVLRFAAGVELLHLFALVHDDVMDHSTTRRGQPTIHRVIRRSLPRGDTSTSEHLAIVLGDLLHVRATALLSDGSAGCPGGRAAIDLISEASCRAATGQFLDLLGWQDAGADIDHARFREVLLDKGGHHSVTAPLLAGWRLIDPDTNLDRLRIWGRHIGLAFQGLDDLQDAFMPPEILGKDGLQDLRRGRLSLVGYLLRTHSTRAEWTQLAPRLGHGVMDMETRRWIFHLLGRHDILTRGLTFVTTELDAARRCSDSNELREEFATALQEVENRLRAFSTRLTSSAR